MKYTCNVTIIKSLHKFIIEEWPEWIEKIAINKLLQRMAFSHKNDISFVIYLGEIFWSIECKFKNILNSQWPLIKYLDLAF